MTWRAASWAGHCLLRRPAVARFREPDFLLALPPVWSGGGSTTAYLWRERREPELALFARLVQPDMVVLEGGASTGSYTLTAAARVGPGGRVIAMEPGDRSRAWLERSKALNRFEHLVIRREALWERTGTAPLHRLYGRDVAWSLSAPAGKSTETIPMETITVAAALEREGLGHVDLLKLEIEGAEEATLRAAAGVLASSRPLVLFTVNPPLLRLSGQDRDGAIRVLRESGYRLFGFVENDVLVERESSPPRYGHLLAVPAERDLPPGVRQAMSSRLPSR